jgi:hypothetical protein
MCTSCLLPVLQKKKNSVQRLKIRRKKNPQKLNVFFLDQNCRNFTPQKLPVIRYIDDDLSLNNSRFGDFIDRIYPIELEI